MFSKDKIQPRYVSEPDKLLKEHKSPEKSKSVTKEIAKHKALFEKRDK